MIGCKCPVCTSLNPANRRRRSAVYVKAGETAFVIDTPPDFRDQCLENDLCRLDAILYTHAHADHILGLDDVRRFNTLRGGNVIPVYAAQDTLAEIRRIFNYISETAKDGLFRPLINFTAIDGSFTFNGITATPVQVVHNGPTYGYRIDFGGGSFGYVPDCKILPPEAIDVLKGVDVMILDALRYREHATHLCIGESCELFDRIGASRNYFTHLCHDIEHEKLCSELPPHIRPAHDGLNVKLI